MYYLEIKVTIVLDITFTQSCIHISSKLQNETNIASIQNLTKSTVTVTATMNSVCISTHRTLPSSLPLLQQNDLLPYKT